MKKNVKTSRQGFAMIMVLMTLALLSVMLAAALTATNTFRIQINHAKKRLERKAKIITFAKTRINSKRLNRK